MFSWLADHANLICLVFGVAALALAVGWWMTRSRKLLLALIPVAVIIAGVFLLSLFVVTDKKRIDQIVQEMAQGVRERNIELIFQHVANAFDRANNTAMSKAQLQALARKHINSVENFSLSACKFGEVSREKGRAEVEFWAHGGGAIDNAPIRVEAEFVLEEGQWRMKSFTLFVGNTGNRYPWP